MMKILLVIKINDELDFASPDRVKGQRQQSY